MKKLYSLIDSINLISIFSLAVLWANYFKHFLSDQTGPIFKNFLAITGIYAPWALLLAQAVLLGVRIYKGRKPEPFEKTSMYVSFGIVLVMLLYYAVAM